MKFDRMIVRMLAVAVLSASVLWAQIPEAMAADAARPSTGGIAAQTKLARVSNTNKKKKARKAKHPKKAGRKSASKKSRKKATPA